ncbi:dnak suppressor protein [hydrocarbon metagenome]|uniref:Dnak suppressor protein n=1 Tax=hydrocarbon metagenome TaxID=938273 RepID=A0A0W8E2L1_9ZZZZ
MVYQTSLHIRKQEIQKMIAEKKDQLMEASTELSVFSHNPDDVVLDLYEREKNSGIIELLEIELEKVNEALQKCAAGEYGKCESCGGAIEDERLQSRVDSVLCHKCAQNKKKMLH